MSNYISTSGFQPPDFSDPNNQHLHIRDKIPYFYYIYTNRHGTTFFVNRTTMKAIPPDSPRTIDAIYSYFSYHLTPQPSKSAIKNAIAAVKGRSDLFPFSHPLYIRVIDSGTTLYLQQSPEFFWCIAHDAIKLQNLPQTAIPPIALGTKPHLNLPPTHPYFTSASLGDLPNQATLNAQQVTRLFDITPLPKDQDLLVLAWLVLTLLPRFEQTALQITGDAQSGKTRTQNLLTSLVDPHDQLIINPSKKNDIQETLLNCYIVSLDDVESLNTEAQSLLRECLTIHTHRYPPRSKAPLQIDLRKPVILNSLEPVVKNKELLKRTITIDIDADQGIAFNNVTDQERSAVFGGLLDLVSHVLANLNGPWDIGHIPTELNDYCHVGYIVANILEGEPWRFIDQFYEHQRHKEREQLEENDVAVAAEKWIQVNPEGDNQTISEWARTLKPYNPDALNWPQSGKAMSVQLRKAKNPLARAGIDVIFEGTRSGHGHCTIRRKD